MSTELILYHCAVVLIGVILGAFCVAVFPLKGNAQAVARNLYLQAIALLFGVSLALYYTLGHIKPKEISMIHGYQLIGESDGIYEEVVDRLKQPYLELDAMIQSYKYQEGSTYD